MAIKLYKLQMYKVVPLELPECWLLESSFCPFALGMLDAKVSTMAKPRPSKAAGLLSNIVEVNIYQLFYFPCCSLAGVQKFHILGYKY